MIEQTCGENLEHESGTLRSLWDRETILPLAWSAGEGNLKKRCDCGLPGSRLVDCEIWASTAMVSGRYGSHMEPRTNKNCGHTVGLPRLTIALIIWPRFDAGRTS